MKIKNSESIKTSKKRILSFIRPSPNSTFNCHNPRVIKLLPWLRLGLSHLREHKFKSSFQDSLNSFCSCGKRWSWNYFSLSVLLFQLFRRTIGPPENCKKIDTSILQKIDSKFTSALLLATLLSTITKTLLSLMSL